MDLLNSGCLRIKYQWRNLKSCYLAIVKNIKDHGSKNLISYVEILPEDLILEIFTLLPVADLIRVGCVSKDWHKYMISNMNCDVYIDDYVPEYKPWYIMFRRYKTRDVIGCFFDPDVQSWRMFDFSYFTPKLHFTFLTESFNYEGKHLSTSHGLVCKLYVKNENKNLFICNPILKSWKRLLQGPTNKNEDLAVALSVDIKCKTYYVALVKTSPKYDMRPGHKTDIELYGQHDVNIELYDSKKKYWTNVYLGSLIGFRRIYQAVICNDIIYILTRTHVVPFDLRSKRFESWISLPRDIALQVKIMNLRGKLILVGLIFADRNDITIRELCCIKWTRWTERTEWNEISRMPYEFSNRFLACESSGFNDFVYIYDKKNLAIFNLSQRTWKYVDKIAIYRKYNLNREVLYDVYGFCWEPRLDISP